MVIPSRSTTPHQSSTQRRLIDPCSARFGPWVKSAVAELSNPRNQRRDPSGDTTTPDVEWLPLKDPEDTGRADLNPNLTLKATVAPAAVADQAAQAEEDTVNSRLPSAVPLRDTVNSAVLNALRDTAHSRLPRDVPLEDTDSSVLPARDRASAALAPVVVRTPADMATLVKDQTRLPQDLLVFARDFKAKQNDPRAIDQADTAARLKLLPSVLRDTALQRDVRLLNAVDTVVQPSFAFQRLQ